jgi:hypothetical protein
VRISKLREGALPTLGVVAAFAMAAEPCTSICAINSRAPAAPQVGRRSRGPR